jgi:hypothetical protein
MSRRLDDLSSRFQVAVETGNKGQDALIQGVKREIEELTTTWLRDITRLREQTNTE